MNPIGLGSILLTRLGTKTRTRKSNQQLRTRTRTSTTKTDDYGGREGHSVDGSENRTWLFPDGSEAVRGGS